jgi:hypothetical protein
MISKKTSLLLGLIFFLSSSAFGQKKSESPTSAKPKKILFIGNSYTGGIRKTVIALIKSSPHSNTQLTFINPGGKTLAFHLAEKETVDKIKSGEFDFVVLQDQSQTPALFPDRFKKAAGGLDKIIDASGAQTVFYQTWGRRDGDKQNKTLFPTYDSMQKALSKSYAVMPPSLPSVIPGVSSERKTPISVKISTQRTAVTPPKKGPTSPPASSTPPSSKKTLAS